MKISGKLHSAENHNGGFIFSKKLHVLTPVFNKTKFGYSVLGIYELETKNNHFKESHNAKNCERRTFWAF